MWVVPTLSGVKIFWAELFENSGFMKVVVLTNVGALWASEVNAFGGYCRPLCWVTRPTSSDHPLSLLSSVLSLYCHSIAIMLSTILLSCVDHILWKSSTIPYQTFSLMPSLISCLVFLKNHVQRNRFVLVIIFVELLLIYHSTTGPQAPINYFQCVLDSASTCRDERGKSCGCLDMAVQSPWALINFPIQQI